MTRQFTLSAHDIERLREVFDQQITGYQFDRSGKPHEHFRTLAGQICTWQIRKFEERGLVGINRASPKRYEIGLTTAGRQAIEKYRARPFNAV